MEWRFEEKSFNPDNIVLNGNRFILGNGYMGYRGTLEEMRRENFTACILNGVYDRNGDKWREPVNMPNPLWTQLYHGQTLCHAAKAVKHNQTLDFRFGIHRRQSEFADGVTIEAERFLSHDNVHLMAMKYTVSVPAAMELRLVTGIDTEIWDINGPHLKDAAVTTLGNVQLYTAKTGELGLPVACAEVTEGTWNILPDGTREQTLRFAEAGSYTFIRYAAVATGADGVEPGDFAVAQVKAAQADGYETLKARHAKRCEAYWHASDVEIEGDDEAQYAMRYSLYHLMILAPHHSGKVSIPARGISGQVYKGAVFWDTEMFMSPFFNLTDPGVARNLLLYRANGLEGARHKAAEYGKRGAFYAWESQEKGEDACSLFNVPDVFTGRPMRTYFRDKQVHVSADVVLALKKYLCETGDHSVLQEGCFEMAMECARFFWSYGYYNADLKRYEILDVVGPDEYHERVANNAFTNRMVKMTLETALTLAETVKKEYPETYREVQEKIRFEEDLPNFKDMLERLYIPSPGADGLIEQFDRYFTLEECKLDTVRSRLKDPSEYWGGGNGVAVMTRVIKQADVMLMLHLFRDDYDLELIRKNWEYYEPHTEHGSTLSACVYAMTAAAIGRADWAYQFYMKTATVDLSGQSKQFIGDLYIGGTHPAANGGTYLSAVFGFCGLRVPDHDIRLEPGLPHNWKSVTFRLKVRGGEYLITVKPESVRIEADAGNPKSELFLSLGKQVTVHPGEAVEITK